MQETNRQLVEFLERAGPGLLTLLSRLTLREDAAADLMQDLFLRLSNSEGFRRSDNPTAYAQRAAINLALDWRRSRKAEPAALDESNEPPAKGRLPLTRLIEREELEQILDGVSKLTGCAGLAFVMRHIQQQSYEDIARALDKEPHQVRALCSKAMGQLRSMLGCGEGKAPEMGVCDA